MIDKCYKTKYTIQNIGTQLNSSISLQQSLISKFITGDPFWDPIINLFIYMIISTISNKSVAINYITENKKVCSLYKAVDWYISTLCMIDYITETPLYVLYEDD